MNFSLFSGVFCTWTTKQVIVYCRVAYFWGCKILWIFTESQKYLSLKSWNCIVLLLTICSSKTYSQNIQFKKYFGWSMKFYILKNMSSYGSLLQYGERIAEKNKRFVLVKSTKKLELAIMFLAFYWYLKDHKLHLLCSMTKSLELQVHCKMITMQSVQLAIS